MADEIDTILLLFVFILFRLRRRRRRLAQLKRRRTFWVRQLFADRKTSGEYWILVLQMKATDRELYFRYVDFTKYSFFLGSNLILLNVLKICILQFGNIVF